MSLKQTLQAQGAQPPRGPADAVPFVPDGPEEDDGTYAPLPDSADPELVPVALAVLRAIRSIAPIAKADQFNQGGTRYNYRSMDRILRQVKPSLERHGILLVPEVTNYEGRDVQRQSGGRSHESIVTVRYWVYGPKGDCLPHPVTMVGEAMDTSDKDASKAQTVAWRNAVVQLLQIATGDPDPDAERIDRGAAPAFDPIEYRDEALNPKTSIGRLSQMIHDMQSTGNGQQLVTNEVGDEEKIGALVWRQRKERSRPAGLEGLE